MTVPASPLLIVDFLTDWKHYLAAELFALGYSVNIDDDADALGVQYFTVKRGLIKAAIRKVVEADTFRLDGLSDELRDGYIALKGKFERGEAIAPHQSGSWHSDAGFFDGMFNDWGIHHLHLGVK